MLSLYSVYTFSGTRGNQGKVKHKQKCRQKLASFISTKIVTEHFEMRVAGWIQYILVGCSIRVWFSGRRSFCKYLCDIGIRELCGSDLGERIHKWDL